jgi:Monooxygenase af470-like
METKVDRRTVDLSPYPELVVIYLGMRVNRLTGLKTLFGFGPRISNSVKAQPDGLLLHEPIVYSLFPMHVGMRQYWRNMESLLRWAQSEPHREWWKSFLKDSGGTGFWHETYLRTGGMEAVYDDVPKPVGMMKFALTVPARGAMFGAAARAGRASQERPVLTENELYGG